MSTLITYTSIPNSTGIAARFASLTAGLSRIVRRGALAADRFFLHTFSMAHPIPESGHFCVHRCSKETL